MPAKILVVDDELSQQMLLGAMLELEGYAVSFASDGRQAEHRIKNEAFDLVILDVNLPYRNGLDVCRQAKQDPDTQLIPIVMVTALFDSQDRIRGIEAGADDFLSKPIDRCELKARVYGLLKRKEYTDELDRADHVLMALGRSIEAKDPYTEGHCERISRYSTMLGERLKLSQEDLRALRIAGSVHDIGKVGVPDAILLKKGPLLEEEWQVMRSHTLMGERICRPLRSFQAVLPIIRNHHEKQNGTGYPDALTGDSIPLLARVMQITDVFDALTTERPYKRAFTASEALRQMQVEVDMGWWDAALFKVFCDVVRDYGLPYTSISLMSA